MVLHLEAQFGEMVTLSASPFGRSRQYAERRLVDIPGLVLRTPQSNVLSSTSSATALDVRALVKPWRVVSMQNPGSNSMDATLGYAPERGHIIGRRGERGTIGSTYKPTHGAPTALGHAPPAKILSHTSLSSCFGSDQCPGVLHIGLLLCTSSP